jgi:hypothetical protein
MGDPRGALICSVITPLQPGLRFEARRVHRRKHFKVERSLRHPGEPCPTPRDVTMDSPLMTRESSRLPHPPSLPFRSSACSGLRWGCNPRRYHEATNRGAHQIRGAGVRPAAVPARRHRTVHRTVRRLSDAPDHPSDLRCRSDGARPHAGSGRLRQRQRDLVCRRRRQFPNAQRSEHLVSAVDVDRTGEHASHRHLR